MTKDPHSLLAKLALHDLSERSRTIFIDRDGTHFRYILNFLRDGRCVLPCKQQHLQELRQEASYFQVQGLLDVLHISGLENFQAVMIACISLEINKKQGLQSSFGSKLDLQQLYKLNSSSYSVHTGSSQISPHIGQC